VGEEIGIMIDVNWAWTVPQAIQMGRELEQYNIYWLEDPVSSILNGDVDDLAKVANALDTPVAGGETFYSKHGFRPLFEKRAVDVLIIDIMCVGGVTEWMKVAAMAQAWNMPVAGHLFHEFMPHLVAAVPNGLFVEYLPWWEIIYKEPPQIKDGYIKIPDKPGLGWELDPKVLKKYEMK
jgi:L-alanine-DL-glutamate epimerase-like enolase superfamily enzyme